MSNLPYILAQIVPFGANLTQFASQIVDPCDKSLVMNGQSMNQHTDRHREVTDTRTRAACHSYMSSMSVILSQCVCLSFSLLVIVMLPLFVMLYYNYDVIVMLSLSFWYCHDFVVCHDIIVMLSLSVMVLLSWYHCLSCFHSDVVILMLPYWRCHNYAVIMLSLSCFH